MNAKVVISQPNLIYKELKKPPTVNRGFCPECNYPVIGFLKAFPRLELAMVPSYTLAKNYDLAKSRAHYFYDTRIANIEDDLPKYTTYLSSMSSATSLFLRAALARK